MKKILSTLLLIGMTFILVACQDTLTASYYKDSTQAGSDNNTFGLFFIEDKRIQDKCYDVLVKSDVDNFNFVLKEEFEEEKTLNIEKKDRWYSLTTLLVKSDNKPNTEDFVQLKDAINKTYIVNSDKDATLNFKTVSGDKFENFEQNGYLLANQIDISNEYKLKIKKTEQK